MIGTSAKKASTRRRWTIYDVAREAGVTAKTVSRVLNAKGGVSQETRERIQRIIARVGFRPHIAARSLRGNRSACIGVTLPAPMEIVPVSQHFFIWLFEQLYRTFGIGGEYVCFDVNPYTGGGTSGYARGVLEHLFKACVIAGPLALNDKDIFQIHESGVPYIAMGRLETLPECSCATVDYEEGAYISTRFLLERGHRRIAMLKGFEGFFPSVERSRGYGRALQEAGIEVDEALIRSVDFETRNIANMVHRLLVDSRVTALIDCSATEDSSGLREGMRRAGRIPGKDLEVVAWTYSENGAVLSEAAAHVWLPVREVAAEGIEQLAAWTHGKRKGPIRVVYRPVLFTSWANGEVSRPKRLFGSLE